MNREMVLEKELDRLYAKPKLDDDDERRARFLSMRIAAINGEYPGDGASPDPQSYRKTASTERSPWFERYLRYGEKRDMTSAGADQKLVAPEFSYMLNQAAKQHDELWDPEVTTLWRTKTGARAGYPTSSIVNLPASKVSEAGLDSTGAPSITSTIFGTCPSFRTVEVILQHRISARFGFRCSSVVGRIFWSIFCAWLRRRYGHEPVSRCDAGLHGDRSGG